MHYIQETTLTDYMHQEKRGEEVLPESKSVDEFIQRLKHYIGKYEWGLITYKRNNTDNMIDNRMTVPRKQKWEEKQLYSRFKCLINNISHDKTWTWLRIRNFK